MRVAAAKVLLQCAAEQVIAAVAATAVVVVVVVVVVAAVLGGEQVDTNPLTPFVLPPPPPFSLPRGPRAGILPSPADSSTPSAERAFVVATFWNTTAGGTSLLARQSSHTCFGSVAVPERERLLS